MPDERTYTLSQIAALTGLHKNTIRNYLKKGIIKAELRDSPGGGQVWTVTEHNLYNSGSPKLNRLLGPQATAARIERQQVAAAAVPDRYLEELLRVTRELTAAQTELALLQDQVPRLQAAAGERDQLLQDNTRLQTAAEQVTTERDQLRQDQAAHLERITGLEAKAQVLQVALDQARADMKWSARRRLKKGGS